MGELDRGASGSSVATDLVDGKTDNKGADNTDGKDQNTAAGDTQGDAGQATQGDLPGWTTSTTKNLRADQRFAAWASKYKTLDDAILHSIELEEKAGKMVELPDENAKEEAKEAFFEKLGVPKKPEDYKLDIDKNLEVKEEDINNFKNIAHALHLTQKQANDFFKLANEKAIKAIEDFTAANEKAKQETAQALKKEWGDRYEEERSVVARGVRYAPNSAQLLKDAEETGMGNRLSFIKLLHKLGQISLEDSAAFKVSQGGRQKSDAEVLYGKE